MFSELLQELRKDKGFTQADVAQEIGVATSTVGNYETGHSQPSMETLIKIADLFDVNMDFLFERIRNRTSWNSMTIEFKTEQGSVLLQEVIDNLNKLSVHERTMIFEILSRFVNNESEYKK